jgi:WS/DGAT/MGAT family acyltransferase
MLARSAVSLAGHPLRAARLSYGLTRSLPALATSAGRPRLPVIDRVFRPDPKDMLSQPGLRPPRTPFNRPISPHRRWAFRDVPLAEVKRVKKAAGVTVNDVVMALCAGALRRWLIDHQDLPDAPLMAGVPVSVRSENERGTHGNRVSSMLAALPTTMDEPWDRLLACHQAMRAAKEQHGALPADLLADVTEFAMPALAGQAARLSAKLRIVERIAPFNLIISNVPGPNVPLYYAGAELVSYCPLSAIADGQGLNITVMSYRDGMFFGLIACRELVPDLDDMAGHMVTELALLSAEVDRRASSTGRTPSRTRKNSAGKPGDDQVRPVSSIRSAR